MGKYDFELDMYDENTISWIASRVESMSCVLEFGPANGRLTKYLKEQKKCKVDIVEIDDESGSQAAEYAEKALLGIEEGNIENYYWLHTNKKYDYIIFADVLEHLVHPEEVIRKCKSIIKNTGFILVSIPNIAHNSVIIELLNDRFNYNSTGILDNTHLRFFTRQSFERIALDAGWAIVGEKAKNIRVGETEIKNSYSGLAKGIYKELVHRPQGDIYQYMFVLALSEQYLSGNCERMVSMDSTSYYFAEVQYEVDEKFDYRQSINRHYDPYFHYIDLEFKVLNNSKRALIKPLNTNCLLEDMHIFVEKEENIEEIYISGMNGKKMQQTYCFNNNFPEIQVEIPDKADKLMFKAHILMYDWEDDQKDIINKWIDISDKNKELENLVLQKDSIITESDNALAERDIVISGNKQKIEELLLELKNKDQKMSESMQKYENEINRREAERLELLKQIKNQNRILTFCKNKGKILLNKIQKKKIITQTVPSKYVTSQTPIRLVTAVIPNYNYARYLDERIDSILNQTYPVSEIIILDDCSSDNSIEVINKRIAENHTGIPMRLVVNEKNSGSVFAQWQKAFQLAKGEFVWIAEADDSCNERFLETIMTGFNDDDVVISYCESLTMDENNVLLMGDLRVWIDIFNTGKWDRDYIKDGKVEVAETMCINNTIANVSSAVIRNGDYYSILEEAKSYKLAGDWYAYMNILKKGKIAYFKESLNYHRMQKQGLTLSTSHEREFAEIVRLQNFALENFDVSDEVKEKVYERRERERVRFGL